MAVARFDAVDLGDAGMVQRGERPRLALEARDPVGVRGKEVGQDLDRDVPIEARVARPVDLAHPARTKGSEDLVPADSRTWGETHEREYTGR